MTDGFLTSLFSLDGKVAVVIGGTGDLCGAMGEGLARAGAEVVIVGRNDDKARARIAKIDAAGGRGVGSRGRRQGGGRRPGGPERGCKNEIWAG